MGLEPVICPRCKWENSAGTPRCKGCGKELPTPSSVPTVDPSRAPTPVVNKLPPRTAPKSAAPPAKPGTKKAELSRAPTVATPLEKKAKLDTKTEPARVADEPAKPAPPALGKRELPRGAPVAAAWLHCPPLAPIVLPRGGDVVVGRLDTCDLVLSHTEVSRQHVTLRARDGDLFVEDRGSSNGTYLNGAAVRGERPLKLGDIVEVGPYEIVVRAGRETPAAEQTRISFGTRAAFTGKLDEVSVVEVLQGIESNRKTGVLALVDGRKVRGDIAFRDGRPIRALFGDERDTRALLSMLRVRAGRFFFNSEPTSHVEQTVALTVTELFELLARESKEVGELLDEAPRS